MNQNIKIIFLITLMYTSSLYSMGWMLPSAKLDPKQVQILAEHAGTGLIKGASAEIEKQLANTSPETTQKILDTMGVGATKAFEEGGTWNQAASNFGKIAGYGAEFIKKHAITMGAISLSIAAAHQGIIIGSKVLERYLTTPKLIIASSAKGLKGYLKSFFGTSNIKEFPMIFSPSLQERLNNIVQVTKIIHTKIKAGKTNVKYRNLMLYGPPGTGKTLFATELAKRSGLEWALMTGSSFSKFKEGEGIEALDELFAWANRTTGLMIFIDEAEAFLSKRENMDPQSRGYQILNNFLNYTGTRSNKFMIVFATNHKNSLDSAMYRRIDDLVEIPLPELPERIALLNLYKNLILLDPKDNDKEFIQSVTKVLNQHAIAQIAQKTKGLSGSELEGIINALRTDAAMFVPEVITSKLVDTVVAQAMEKHRAFTGSKQPALDEQ